MPAVAMIAASAYSAYAAKKAQSKAKKDVEAASSQLGEQEQGNLARQEANSLKNEMSFPERKAYLESFGEGKTLSDIYKNKLTGETPYGFNYEQATDQFKRSAGDLSKSLYDRSLKDLQDSYEYDPRKLYSSTRDIEMARSQDAISSAMKKRGLGDVFKSGLGIESLGRTGADIALRESNKQLELEALQNARRQQGLANALGMTDTIRGVEAANLAGLEGKYKAGMGYGLAASNRQAGLATPQLDTGSTEGKVSEAYGRGAGAREAYYKAISNIGSSFGNSNGNLASALANRNSGNASGVVNPNFDTAGQSPTLKSNMGNMIYNPNKRRIAA